MKDNLQIANAAIAKADAIYAAGEKTMKYSIHYYKTENLTPDERNAQRKNQRGIWLDTGIRTEDRAAGFREARRDFRGEKFRAALRF